MLTSLLVLVSSLGAVQDAVPAPTPAQDAPAAAPEAPAAPAETPEKVRNFLAEAEKQFYDPQAMGLKSVEFDAAVIIGQLGGEIGKVHVSWATDSEPSFNFTKSETAQLPPGVPPEALVQAGEQMGRPMLDALLNRPVAAMTRDAVATMDAAQDGLVKISLKNPKAAAQGVKEQACYFNDDGLLQKSTMLIDGAATGMPIGDLPITTLYTWKPVTAGSDLMIPDGTVEEADLGMIGKLTSRIKFVSRSVDGIVLVTGMERSTETPGGGGEQAQNVEAENLVVNGKPVAAPDAPAPAGG